jgi:hypothetical protein
MNNGSKLRSRRQSIVPDYKREPILSTFILSFVGYYLILDEE